MPKIIIADTSCLIILSKIGELAILRKLYGEILITKTIQKEFGKKLPKWINIAGIHDIERQKILELQVDEGEASAITLALEYPDSTLILDDLKARKVAERLGINYTGTIGVIIKAKRGGIIPSVKNILNKIKKTNFRISEDIEKAAIRAANE